MELWLEYEKGETGEAQWVREMDKLECLVQAHEYEQKTFGKKDLTEFQGLSAKIHSPAASEWAGFVRQERHDHFARRGQQSQFIFITGMHFLVFKFLLQPLKETGNSSASESVAVYVSKALEIPCISIEKIVHERARDHNYAHQKIIQNCLEKDLDVPASIIVALIRTEIEVIGDRPWILVAGFPKGIEQLTEFERKVNPP